MKKILCFALTIVLVTLSCKPVKKPSLVSGNNGKIVVDSVRPKRSNLLRQCGELVLSEKQREEMAAFYAKINGEIERDMQERDINNVPEMLNYPIAFRVMSENGRMNVSRKYILEALQNLNRVYNKNYIQFNLVGIDSLRSDLRLEDLYYGLMDNRADDFFEKYNKDKIINIYLTENSDDGSYLNGFTYPVDLTYEQGRNRDLICIATRTIDNGKTLIHEMGHFFTLLHTFNVPGCNGCKTDEHADGSNCSTTGDFICDTPADPGDGAAVDVRLCRYTGNATDNNGQVFRPMINNFMSYYEACCDYQFTSGQQQLMRKIAMNYRQYLKRKAVQSTPPKTVATTATTIITKPTTSTITISKPVVTKPTTTATTPKAVPKSVGEKNPVSSELPTKITPNTLPTKTLSAVTTKTP